MKQYSNRFAVVVLICLKEIIFYILSLLNFLCLKYMNFLFSTVGCNIGIVALCFQFEHQVTCPYPLPGFAHCCCRFCRSVWSFLSDFTTVLYSYLRSFFFETPSFFFFLRFFSTQLQPIAAALLYGPQAVPHSRYGFRRRCT